MIIKNAIIESTYLTRKNVSLSVKTDSYNQDFVGFDLDTIRRGYYIERILEVLEVESWEKLPGKIIRIRKTEYGDFIRGVGHPLKDQWFIPTKESLQYIGDNKTFNVERR